MQRRYTNLRGNYFGEKMLRFIHPSFCKGEMPQ